jgi:hypothetical protein
MVAVRVRLQLLPVIEAISLDAGCCQLNGGRDVRLRLTCGEKSRSATTTS